VRAKSARACGVAEKRTIAIIGLPNTGKSVIFNHLTGEYTVVANYAQTTVETKRTDCFMNGCRCEVIDTPGLHCLSIHAEEELAIRDLVFSERPDVIVQCIDACQFKQSLTLTCDLLELNIPMVIALNAIDESTRRGMWIDSTGLAQMLGVPVIETIATQGRGMAELRAAIAYAAKSPAPVRYGDTIENAIADLQDLLGEGVAHSRRIALLMCMGDPFVGNTVGPLVNEENAIKLKACVTELILRYRGDVATAITNRRNQWIDEIAEKTIRRQKVAPSQFSKTLGHLCRHPVFGVPILFMFLAATFFLVVHVAGFLEIALHGLLERPIIAFVSAVVPSGFLHDLLVGKDYGVLTLGLFNAVCTVLPILSVFFLAFGILEDIGYIPNLCVLTRRIFGKVGLKGRSVMSLMLGFGCKTMATLTTLGLPRKEKLIAVYLIAATIPCSAQMGLSMGLLGRYSFWAFLATYGMLIVIAAAAGALLNRLIPREDRSDLIQELPAMRLPNIKAVGIKTYYRLYWFLKEALPIFLVAALALFLMNKVGVLAALKVALRPVVEKWFGMPVDVVDAIVLCVARHEAAAGMLIRMADAGKLDVFQCMAAVLLTTIFVPCFANIVAMCKRVGIKTGVAMTLAMNASAFFIVGVFYWVLVFLRGVIS